MRSFRAGTFEREHMPRALRNFSPAVSVEKVESVDLSAMKDAGKSLVLLDVDNTLLPWRGDEFPSTVIEWIRGGKALGLQFCILSNTRHPERLERLSKTLDIPYIRAKFKPSRQMYFMALDNYGAKPEGAVMIGDQLLTDVLGANRSGIDAVWIKPVGKREFVGTRVVSRNIERIVGAFLHNYFQPDGSVLVEKAGFFQHNIVRQFVKFCMVGGVSTVIDLGLHRILMFNATINGERLSDVVGQWAWSLAHGSAPATHNDLFDYAFAPLKVPVVVLAILNSYYWNRKWTFKVDENVSHRSMILKFYAVALIGLVINTGVATVTNRVLNTDPEKSWAGASLIAMVVTVFWNFFGQRMWTFKKVGQ